MFFSIKDTGIFIYGDKILNDVFFINNDMHVSIQSTQCLFPLLLYLGVVLIDNFSLMVVFNQSGGILASSSPIPSYIFSVFLKKERIRKRPV